MRKFLFLFVVVISLQLLLSGCSNQTTVEGALKEVNIEIEKIYSVVCYNNISIAFYKDKKSGHQTVGLFNTEKEKLSFIKQQDLQLNVNVFEDITFTALFQDKGQNSTEFCFQFGTINNPQIDKIKLHMTDPNNFGDRFAEIIELDGLRVWYTFLDVSRMFNIQQGISKDGKVVYSNI